MESLACSQGVYLSHRVHPKSAISHLGEDDKTQDLQEDIEAAQGKKQRG